MFYGWAERNTRPEVPSDERVRNKLNGLLCVDAHSGEEYFRLSPQAKTEDVSEYLAEFCLDCVELGVRLALHHSRQQSHAQAKDALTTCRSLRADGTGAIDYG